jgi:two-component system, OmpR family, sensor histidine kinase KdpD
MAARASLEASDGLSPDGPKRGGIRRNTCAPHPEILVPRPVVATKHKNVTQAGPDNVGDKVDPAYLAAGKERLYSTLLTSVAHDLRTPLTSILGSATTLREYRRNLNEADQNNLIDLIQAEAERLNRLIANVLDQARLDTDTFKPHLDLVPMDDIIGGALARADLILSSHRVVLDLVSDLPMLKLNPVLFEQVVFNLLDNTAKYSFSGTEVRLVARYNIALVRLEVLDEGHGIPPCELELVFDKFYRIRQATPKPTGIGLGLSICRGFVEAMGGTIVADNRPDQTGSVFTITFRR